MSEAFHLGGWGMFPTTFIGLLLLAVAVQYARQPDQRRLHVIRHLNVLVGLSAMLGFVKGAGLWSRCHPVSLCRSPASRDPQRAVSGLMAFSRKQ